MKNKFVISIIISTLLSITGDGYSKEKAKYEYLTYLPEGYHESTAAYPLVIYLHGGSQRGNDLNLLKGYGLPSMVEKGSQFEFLIASPQCPKNKYWYSENWFESLIEELKANYRIDESRIYLTGFSMGGYGVFITAMDFPETFAALLPLAGGCDDENLEKLCSLKNIPIWTFHGTQDKIIPIIESEKIQSVLDKCGGKIEFTRLDGEGHGIQYIYEQREDLYSWLLKQKR
ncbi:prolyl oligopeptidase family serine peptidase [Puniceicoccaceae bacterium K14]|nr:prolyl oligopeptidase family serine peptidase [Puniceicoccaceae bacterium K14]